MSKQNKRYVHIYMDQDTYQEFRSKCPDDLFRQLTISNIKYSHKACHDRFRYWYPLMISTHIKNTPQMYDVIKQIELWRQKIHWNYLPPDNKPSPQRAEQILNILESIKNWQLKNVQNNPQTTTPTVNKAITPAEPTPNSYKITDLTPKMVQQMLNVRWDHLYLCHFYHNPDYQKDSEVEALSNIKHLLESHPDFNGRELAFIASIPTVYTCGTYTHQPNHSSQIDEDDDPYDLTAIFYSTFISYNPKTKQFEKYPRGWIQIGEKASLRTIQQHMHHNATEILSAFNKEKQNTR